MSDKKKSEINLKELLKSEYAKCAKDPIYFMKKYVKIQHPTKGTIPFLTYPFQDMALQSLGENSKNIILKSRQMGITTLVSAYSLWLMTFFSDKEIMCLSITQETSKAIVTKVRFANDNLPGWLKRKATEDNRLSLKLDNGSRIAAASSAGTSGRSSALSLLIIDEAAFIDGIEDIWLSAQFTLSTGGDVIILSTPNGVGNFFHKKWIESEAGQNDLNRISLPWHLHPDRDQVWRDEQTKLSGIKGAAQECDCEFSTSGNTVVDIPVLEWYTKNQVRDPMEKRGIDRGYWIFEYPKPGRSYMVSADVGRGDAEDFSAAQVIDIETLEQVAEYRGKLPTKDYASALMTIATEYNMALLVIENANIGWAVIQEVLDKNYQNLFYSSADLQYVDVESQMTNKLNAQERKMTPGFTTSSKTRPLVISKLESYFRSKEVTVHSVRLIDELNVFVWKQGGTTLKAEAMAGYHDDLVMAFGIAMWIRDVALRLRGEADGAVSAILSRIGSSTSAESRAKMKQIMPAGANNPYGVYADPWKMRVGAGPGGNEDLTWLING
jgi:hypothetical protein